MNDPELGESEGESKRMDMVNGRRHVVSLNICASGFRLEDEIEWESVGEKLVGVSYLYHIVRHFSGGLLL